MPKQKYSNAVNQLRAILETKASEVGCESGFVQRDSKLTASCFVQAMVLACLEKVDPTLTDFVQVCESLGVTISNSGFNQRIDEEAVALLQELLVASTQLSQPERLESNVLARFTAVNILDSSYISLPAALHAYFAGLGRGHAAGAKVVLSYEYRRGEIGALEVLPGRTADQQSRLHVNGAQPGSLTLFDLGFFKQETFAELAGREAYFISRYQVQTALYTPDGTRFDLVACLGQTTADQLQLSLLLGEKARVPVDLVCQRLPATVASERRRKARQKAKADGRRHGPPAPRTLFLLGWSLYITNLPQAWLTVDQIQLLYRVRWQIELLFKLWKSRAQLDQVGNFRPARLLCQFYARLIGIVLFHWLVAPTYCHEPQLSLPKAFKLLQHHIPAWRQAIAHRWRGAASVLARVVADWLRLGRKDKRKKSPSTFCCLLQGGL